MRLVFCGTPQFAVPTLRAVLAAGHRIQLVVTQPDRPRGRGMELASPPVKQLALEQGLPVTQPEKIRDNLEFCAQLEAIQPDAILVVAYGRIIPPWMLSLPRYGNLNLHASLLPKYRGAAPIQWAVAMGESVTGNTTMRIDAGLDTGDILLQQPLAIGPAETAAELSPRLAVQGAALMVETLRGLDAGTLAATKQDSSAATLAPILTREEGRINFSRTAGEIYNRWRGFQPWPGAYTEWQGKKFVAHGMALTGQQSQTEPGTIRIAEGHLFVTCGEATVIEFTEVQLEGRRRMAAREFLRGVQKTDGLRLGGRE
jgi:methionyl-tRNA formyltransferase